MHQNKKEKQNFLIKSNKFVYNSLDLVDLNFLKAVCSEDFIANYLHYFVLHKSSDTYVNEALRNVWKRL